MQACLPYADLWVGRSRGQIQRRGRISQTMPTRTAHKMPTDAIESSRRSSARKARDQNERSGQIVAFATGAIISKDRAGLITSWNLGAERLYGYREDEVLECPISLIIPEDLKGPSQNRTASCVVHPFDSLTLYRRGCREMVDWRGDAVGGSGRFRRTAKTRRVSSVSTRGRWARRVTARSVCRCMAGRIGFSPTGEDWPAGSWSAM